MIWRRVKTQITWFNPKGTKSQIKKILFIQHLSHNTPQQGPMKSAEHQPWIRKKW
jgi:hypothetical protein